MSIERALKDLGADLSHVVRTRCLVEGRVGVGAQLDAVENDPIQARDLLEVVIERKKTGTLVDGARGDPHVVGRNRCACAPKTSEHSSVVPRHGFGNGKGADERFG